MVAPENRFIKKVKQNPYATPNNNNSYCNRDALCEVFYIEYVHVGIIIHNFAHGILTKLIFSRIILIATFNIRWGRR